MSILSIQSHVVYGYVGNKAAIYPLQSMGYDVWPINTVQFSNHTGYGKWQGEIFSPEHIRSLVNGLEDLRLTSKCRAILSGYMGSAGICEEVYNTYSRLKSSNDKLIYLCDPVIGNTSCFVKPEVLDFFKTKLKADIITPNQFEAENLSGIKITDIRTLKSVTDYFHNLGINIVVITGINSFESSKNNLSVVVSDTKKHYLIETKEFNFPTPVNGTGDLFSAVFLGNYLATNSAITALQTAIYYIEQVLSNTLSAKERELQVTSVNYRQSIKQLPVYVEV